MDFLRGKGLEVKRMMGGYEQVKRFTMDYDTFVDVPFEVYIPFLSASDERKSLRMRYRRTGLYPVYRHVDEGKVLSHYVGVFEYYDFIL